MDHWISINRVQHKVSISNLPISLLLKGRFTYLLLFLHRTGSHAPTRTKILQLRLKKSSDNPHYLAFVIWYQQGKKDITAVQLCETQNFVCKLLDRTHGAVWTTTSPPRGPLQIRMLLSVDDEDETWVVPVNNIPENWKAGDTYDSGIQADA
ncbi:hypothetical protein H5410_043155 [Solanum commersonii]|uniref:Expansin-like CBD domain-containing protein n=1 Tax=Solanum commersonii TaxID=4109 RepID=A0A9J5XWS2_SOLCO|nr:hypothetical protein H5410_043155 [Solanum commersonii]